MKILALETTEKTGQVAAMCDGKLLLELTLEQSQQSAQSLAPGIDALLRKVGWQPGEVDLVAVCTGPGSFTGLRIGVTTAKTFAYAVGAAILGIDTLETIAAASPEDVEQVTAVMDAQRGEIVARQFRRQSDGWFVPVGPQTLVNYRAWQDHLTSGASVSGPILAKIAHLLPNTVRVLDQEYWSPKVSVVARLAERDFQQGRRDDVWNLVPRYCRRSAAEEKHDRRNSEKTGLQAPTNGL